MMSGFVIANAYETRLQEGLTARRLIILRLIRLYPLYLAGAAVGIALAVAGFNGKFDGASALLSVFMLPTPTSAQGASLYPYNPVAWSLLLEMIVNVAYALTWRAWTPRRLALIIGASALLLIGATVAHGDANFGWTWRNLPGGLARVFFGFPVGVAIFRLFQSKRLPARSNFFVVMSATIILLCWRPDGGAVIVDLVALLVASPILMAVAVAAEPPKWSMGLVTKLGAASYAIYAVHLPLLNVLQSVAPHALFQSVAPLPGLLFTAGIFTVAYVLDRRFDGPVRARVLRRLQRASRMPISAPRRLVGVPLS